MRTAILAVVGVTLFATVASMQTKVGTAADEAAIKKHADSRLAAYNKHDAKALAALYAADADRVTTNGVFSGKAQIEKSYADVFNDVGKNDILTQEPTKVRFLTAEVAVSDTDNTITGRTTGTVKNHNTGIFMKRNGEWVLVAARTVRMQ